MHGFVAGYSKADLPLINFTSLRKIVEIKQQLWKFEDSFNPSKTLASRKQLPIKLSWSMTNHMPQGQTLECAEIFCGGEFAPGQLYVALSRVKNISGTKIIGFGRANIIPLLKKF